jgi:hypothetical protein
MALPGMQFTADVDIFLGQITEVDMADAGMTVIRSERLLPADLIRRIEALPKLQRSIAVGKIARIPAFKGLANKVTDGIRRRVEEMLAMNNVGTERILSVKRDAVFVTGPPPSSLVLRDGTKFRSKGSYTSFAKLGGIEVYAVPKRGMADLKGIPPEKRQSHQQFTTRMILDVLSLLERGSRTEAAHTVQLFRRDYASRKLPLGFYREFNSASSYAVSAGGRVFQLEGEDGIAVDALEIAYNLRNVIIPLVRGIA